MNRFRCGVRRRKQESVLGEMFGDAVRPALCVYRFAMSPSTSQLRFESRDLGLDFWGAGRVIQSSFPRPFGSQHLGWRELVYSRSDCGCHRGFLAE